MSTKTTIKTYFQQGDRPSQADFTDFIDSCAVLSETSSQHFVGGISVSGAVSAHGGGKLDGFTISNPTFSGTVTLTSPIINTATINTPSVSAGTFNNPTIGSPTVSAGTFASPALTGTPTAPTATVGTNTTQIATMAAIVSARGRVLQVAETVNGNSGTSANLIPADNTIPQISEGDIVVSANFTPQSSTSKIIVDYWATIGASTPAKVIAPLFVDNGVNAVDARIGSVQANEVQTLCGSYSVSSVSTATKVFRLNYGASVSGGTINAWPGQALFGGIIRSGFRITEIS